MELSANKIGIFGCSVIKRMVHGRGRYILCALTFCGLAKMARIIRMRRLREKWASAGKDVVVLHTVPRGNYCPSLSPFALKLETFLRMMDIKYQIESEEPMGSKGKLPWITLNGEDYTDSELIIQKLQVKFNKFPDADVSKEDKAVGLAMRIMMEEHMLCGLASWRYIEDDLKGVFEVQTLSLHHKILFTALKWKVKKALYMQGIGRHSIDEIHGLMRRDIEAISHYLGDKLFLMGETAQVDDCAVFGMLAQILYNSPRSPYLQWIQNDFPNLRDYTERVKRQFWPDWDDCVTKPEHSRQNESTTGLRNV